MAGRTRRAGRSEHYLSLGATLLPLFGEAGRKHRDPIGPDWRVDGPYARIRGRWHYIYRAIDGDGQLVERLWVADTRHGCRAQVLRAGGRVHRHDTTSAHHRHGRYLSARAVRGGAWHSASDRSVSDKRR